MLSDLALVKKYVALLEPWPPSRATGTAATGSGVPRDAVDRPPDRGGGQASPRGGRDLSFELATYRKFVFYAAVAR